MADLVLVSFGQKGSAEVVAGWFAMEGVLWLIVGDRN
jgi:hypothetical protein